MKELLKKWVIMYLLVILCIQMMGCSPSGEKKEEKSEVGVSEKIILTYGVISLETIDPGVQNAIKEFNKTNPDYEIEIKEYIEYPEEGMEDIDTGISWLNADIINGNGPDILSLPIRFSMELYAEKGVLEDLYPYIDKDETIDRSDFLSNIIKAYETEGKLYGIPIVFWIETMVGKTTVIGDHPSWNMEEMIAFADNCPEGILIFEDASKSGVMEICQYANGNQLINWSTEKNPFNRELYIKMLTFSNRFIDDKQYVYDKNLYKRIVDEQLLLMDSKFIVSNPAADTYFSDLFGEPVTYIGYPSETGCGSVVNSLSTMAINARSPYKEAAWEFIRSTLTKEYHENNSFLAGFSIRTDGLEKQFEKAKEMGAYYGVDMHPPKQESIEKLQRLIDNVDSIRVHDSQINDIMTEEAQMYFQGIKTEEEVAEVVENRIRIYVNETK